MSGQGYHITLKELAMSIAPSGKEKSVSRVTTLLL